MNDNRLGRLTFKQILDDLWAEKDRTETKPAMPEIHRYQGISWERGSKFNYRIFAALILLDREEAKRYFRTTS